MNSKKIEVEGGELMLQSEEGHYAIIPARDRKKVQKMVNDNCEGCINNYIQRLPKEANYAEDGSLIEDKENPFLPTMTIFKDNEKCSTTSDCSEFTTTEYANILGVDRNTIDKEVSGDAWYKKDKVLRGGGNEVWNEGENENYGEYQIGDFVSLSNKGRNYAQPKKGTKSDEGYSQEDYARHSGIIVGKDKEGIPIVRHNYLGQIYDEPINNISKASNYQPISVFRGKQAKEYVNEENKRIKKLNVQQEISKNYDPKVNFTIKEGVGEDLYKSYVKNRKDLALGYGVMPKELDNIFKNLIGIAQQESNVDNTNPSDNLDYISQAVQDKLPGWLNYMAKGAKNVYGALSDKLSSYEINDETADWEKQILVDKLIDKGKSKEEALDEVFTEYGISSSAGEITDKSKGPFKQKAPSQYWLKEFGGKEYSALESIQEAAWDKEWDDNDDRYLENAVGLYLENKDKAKEAYPEEDDEFIEKIAILSHNAPVKAKNKKYSDYYIKGIDNPNIKESKSDFLDKTLKHKKELIKEDKL